MKRSPRPVVLSPDDRLDDMSIAVAYSGGPDACALAARLQALGAEVIPVYLVYRNRGGKTSKDLRGAINSAKLLGLTTELLDNPLERAITGDDKSRRNYLILETFARAPIAKQIDAIGLGTYQETSEASGLWTEESNQDLEPRLLMSALKGTSLRLITWDSFGVKRKADEFVGLSNAARQALFATTSCQMWWKVECGNCYSCLERHEAFLSAFGQDPTVYRPNSTVMKRLAEACSQHDQR